MPCLFAQTGYYANLKQLIEHAVELNSGRLATIVAHSQGALVALYFMTRQPSEWVRKHVGSFVAISAPWAGAVSTLKGTDSSPGALCVTPAALAWIAYTMQCPGLVWHVQGNSTWHTARAKEFSPDAVNLRLIWMRRHAVPVQADAPYTHHEVCRPSQ